MTADGWNVLFQAVAVIAAGITFVAGAGALLTNRVVTKRDAARLLGMESDVLKAKADLLSQTERTAIAERDAADAKGLAAKAGEGTAHALADAAAANERASANEREAAELRKVAEQERLARVQIEEKLAPRRLSASQVSQLTSALNAFGGVHVNFFAPSGDAEIVRISNDVLLALAGPVGAKWAVTVSTGQQFGLTVVGIVVELSADADDISKAAAAALVQALRAQRLVTVGPVPPMPRGAAAGALREDRTAKIRVTVGAKP